MKIKRVVGTVVMIMSPVVIAVCSSIAVLAGNSAAIEKSGKVAAEMAVDPVRAILCAGVAAAMGVAAFAKRNWFGKSKAVRD